MVRGHKVTSDVGPFAIVPEWLADSVSPSALTLFVRLALHADRDTDQAWPSRSRLAKLMEASTKSIDRWLAELVDSGAIEKTPRRDEGGWHSSLYLVKYVSPGRSGGVANPSDSDVPQNQNQLEPEPRTRERPSRKRDVLADALAEAEGSDPLEVPASRMRTLCVKANELRKLNPDITPEEVMRRAGNWGSHFEHASITGPAIVTHWGRLANANNGRHEETAEEQLRRLGIG